MPQGSSFSSSIYFVFFSLLLVLFLCNSVTSSGVFHHEFEKREVDREKEELFPSIHRTLIEYFGYKLTEFDSIDPPTTALPSAPITNPVNTAPAVTSPPVNTAPGIVTVPGISSPDPTTTTNPPVPVTNPVTTPTTNNPVTTPTTNNPVTTPTTNNPVTAPAGGGVPTGGNAPAGAGRWCIAKNGASQTALQSAIDYACGIGGADCSTIQQGASCYEPTTLQNHASFAFNSYYQKNPSPTSCDFGGVAALTTTNPSTGSCIYPTSSSSSSPSSTSTTSSPTTTPTTQTPTPTTTTQSPINPTSFPAPTTTSPGSTFPGAQSPPPGFSFGNPDPGTGIGAFGASPPLMNTGTVSSTQRHVSGSLVIISPFIVMMFV